MDVVVSNLAWLPKAGMTEADVFLLKKRLTIFPPENTWGPEDEDEKPRIINMWRETTTHIGVPRAYFMAHKTSKHNIVLRLPSPTPAMAKLVPMGKLRADDQEAIAQSVLKEFTSRPFFGGIICAYTGWGKTSGGIEIARRLGLRTMILVHKNPLKDQWIERIKAWVPDAKIGVVQADKCQFEGMDFVIGMIQSMMQDSGDKYPHEMWSAFGLVIADECLAPDTMVATPLGQTPIGELRVGDEVKRPDGGTARVKAVWTTRRQAVRYTFACGRSLVASENHLMASVVSSLKQFKVANCSRQIVPISKASNVEVFRGPSGPVGAEPLDELTGWFVADGTMERSTAKFGFTKHEKFERLLDVVHAAGITPTVGHCKRGDLIVRLGTVGHDIFAGLGFKDGAKARTAFVPEDMYRRCSSGFLRGLFDGDATFNHDRIEWSTASPRLAQQVSHMLGALGIPHSLRVFARKNSEKHAPVHRVCIFGQQILMFREMVGFRVPSKRQRLEDYFNAPKGPRCRTVREMVVGVDPIGETDLVDIELDSADRLFVANGFVSHNCHRCGAMAFSTVAPKFNAPYFMGLSATPKRKDGCDNAFKWVIGEVIAQPTDKNRTQPIIYLRNTGMRAAYEYSDRRTGETVYVDLNDMKKPTVLKRIAKNKFRNGIIIQDVLKAVKAGRCPLIMAERLDILHCIAEGVQEKALAYLGREITAGMYIGGKKRSELDVAAQSDIVLATVQLAKEGIDIQRLDTLFMATPVGDPVQIIGRIGRAQTVRTADGGTEVIPPKHQPMVVDYIDYDVKALKGTFFSRLKYYKKFGWQTMGMKV